MTNVRKIRVDWYGQQPPRFNGGPQLAYQGDHLSNMVVFDNAPELPNYYLIVKMKTDDAGPVDTLPAIQLEGPYWVIPNYYTQICQQITYQVCCKTETGDYEHHSAEFKGTILPVLKHNGEPIDQSTMFDPYMNILDKKVSELIVAAGDIQIDSELKSDSGNPVQNRVIKAAIDGLGNDVTAVNGRLHQLQTGKIAFESGTFTDPTGSVKNDNAARVRSSVPLPVKNIASITVPSAYQMWIYYLSNTMSLIGTSGWKNPATYDIAELVAEGTAYINIVVRDRANPSRDISDEVATIQSALTFETKQDKLNTVYASAASVVSGIVDFESGTFYENDGSMKKDGATRLRNVSPISTDNLYSVTIPTGYEAWIYRLDRYGRHISAVGTWINGEVLMPVILANGTKYINIAIRNSATPNADISGEAGTVSASTIIKSTAIQNAERIDLVFENVNTIRDYVYQYRDMTPGYTLDVGQAYGNVGEEITFSQGPNYRHVKILKTDNIDKVFFSTIYNISNVSSYVQYVDDNDIIIKRDIVQGTYERGKEYSYVPAFPDGATGMYLTTGKKSASESYVLGIYKSVPLDVESMRIDLDTKKANDYNEIVKSVTRIAEGFGVPHQSIIGYKAAYKAGFRAMLCDLRFTSDGVPVLEHDAYLNGNYHDVYKDGVYVEPNTVLISETTYEELLEYDFGYYAGQQFAGTKIMTFEQMLDLCKCLGCEIYIETKTNLTTAQYDLVFGLIRQYGMEKKCVWNPQSTYQLNSLIAYNPNVYINLHSNLGSGASLTDAIVTAITGAVNNYNRGKVSITLGLGATMTSAQAETLAAAGVEIMGTTLNTEQQVLDYYAQGKPYTCFTSVLTNTIIAGKVLFDHCMNT